MQQSNTEGNKALTLMEQEVLRKKYAYEVRAQMRKDFINKYNETKPVFVLGQRTHNKAIKSAYSSAVAKWDRENPIELFLR